VSQLLVFVYGTLMRGGRYHHLVAASPCLGEVQTVARFALYDLGPYPAMVAGDSVVTGELYRIEEATLAALDRLEAHPTYYRRSSIDLCDGRQALAYLFVDTDELSAAEPIPSGDWRHR